MALRVANKINRQALQNICKSLYSDSPESTCFFRSSSIDASAVASTIPASTSSTIHTNNNKANVPPSANITVAPPTIPVSNPPPSATSMQCSSYTNQIQTPNTPINIDTDEFSSRDLFDKESEQTRLITSSPPQLPPLSTAYQVCPMRSKTAPVNYIRPAKNQFNQASYNKTINVATKPADTTHLQPGNQVDVYIPQMKGFGTPAASAEASRETAEQRGLSKGMKEPSASDTNGGYRKFQESMTYRNLTQPLKFSRLASPFPEPVKETPSQKITDQEKSTQMFAQSRTNAMAQAHFTQHQKQLRLKPQIPIQPSFVRHYTDRSSGRIQGFTMPPPGKYKKIKKVIFKKIKTDKPCPQVNACTTCKDDRYIYKPCTKKEAPYPSYSEFCHEEQSNISRCCPWMEEIHPAFKPRRGRYHTSSRAMSMTSGLTTSLEGNSASSRDMKHVNSISDDENGGTITMELKKRNGRQNPECEPNTTLDKIPCAWVELDKKEKLERAAPQRKKRGQSKVVEKNIASKKDICDYTIQKRCPPVDNANLPPNKKKCRSSCTKILTSTSQPEKKEDTATSRSNAYKCVDPSQLIGAHILHDVATPVVGQSIDEWLAGLRPNKMETYSNGAITSGDPCKKFPFKPCVFDLVINRKPRIIDGQCKKKEKKPIIEDCPQRTTRTDHVAQLFNDVLLFKKKPDDKNCPKDDFKCPQTKPKSKKNKIIELDDPCKSKRQPGSEICPDDLLTRKRKDKPSKLAISNEDEFQEAITMLNSIEKTRSSPSLFTPYIFRQK